MWYAAHGIFYFKLRGRSRQNFYVVHENVLLVNARNSKQAWKKAEAYAKKVCVDDPTLMVDDKPVTYKFAGFRKLISVCHEGRSQSLGSGDEATYSVFHVNGMKAVRQLVSGKTASVAYVE